MGIDKIRKEFLDKMQLRITTTNLRNGQTWWDEYIDFLEEKVSKLHQHTVISAVCPKCKSKNMHELKGGTGTCYDCYHVWKTDL